MSHSMGLTDTQRTIVVICGNCGHIGNHQDYARPSSTHISGAVAVCPQCETQMHRTKAIKITTAQVRETINVYGYDRDLKKLVDDLADQYPYVDRQRVQDALCRHLVRQVEQMLQMPASEIALDPAFRRQLALSVDKAVA
jgi:hypothetical protein